MERPINSHYNVERRTVTLFFNDGESGEYCIRGAICWPRPVEEMVTQNGQGVLVRKVEGYALLGCQDIHTGVIWVMEEQPFVVIDSILDKGKITYEGLSLWFNRNWAKYLSKKYYFQDEYELSRQYRLNISRSKMIEPKPTLIQIDTTKDVDLTHSIWRFISLKQLRYDKTGYLYQKLNLLKQDDKSLNPAIYALQLLCFGFERYPYKERIAA
jgi:hypothetical protein